MVLIQVPGCGILNLDLVRFIDTHVEADVANGVRVSFSGDEHIIMRHNEVTFPYRTWKEFHDNFLAVALQPQSPPPEPEPEPEV